MKIGGPLKVFALGLIMITGAEALLFALLKLTSPEPRTPLVGYFHQVIRDAQISDDYESGVGWDHEDVTEKICPKVDVEMLQALGMKDKPQWRQFPLAGEPRPMYRWQVIADKGLLDTCRDHSVRSLNIEIDAGTLSCSAFVMPLPSCDM